MLQRRRQAALEFAHLQRVGGAAARRRGIDDLVDRGAVSGPWNRQALDLCGLRPAGFAQHLAHELVVGVRQRPVPRRGGVGEQPILSGAAAQRAGGGAVLAQQLQREQQPVLCRDAQSARGALLRGRGGCTDQRGHQRDDAVGSIGRRDKDDGTVVDVHAHGALAHLGTSQRHGRCGRLLHHMGQFVCQQAAASGTARSILAGIEHDVPADGIGQRRHLARRQCGHRAMVHAHGAEIVSEALAELGARGCVQGHAWLAQRGLHALGCG